MPLGPRPFHQCRNLRLLEHSAALTGPVTDASFLRGAALIGMDFQLGADVIEAKPKGEPVEQIIEDIETFAATLPAARAIAGLDLGTATLGVAVSDSFLSVATPLTTIKRRKFGLDAQALLDICDARDIAGLVLGLPRNMDGSEGPRAQSTRAFARNLAKLCDLPITFWDERLSTVAAERALLEADTTRKRRAEVIDHVAAGFILQGVLDRMAHIRVTK